LRAHIAVPIDRQAELRKEVEAVAQGSRKARDIRESPRQTCNGNDHKQRD